MYTNFSKTVKMNHKPKNANEVDYDYQQNSNKKKLFKLKREARPVWAGDTF